MKLALFGAAGFIGSHLVEHLLEGGHQVVGLDLDDEKVAHISRDHFTFHKADIRDSADLTDQMVRESDVVVDLLAHANPSRYVEAPLDVVALNLDENLKIVDRCIEHGKRLIQYSTCEVYGRPANGDGGSWHEDTTPLVYGPIDKHRWIYACAKQLLERILRVHHDEGALEFSVIRPFNFIGPRLDYLVPPATMGGPRVFAHFMSALLHGGPMYLVGGGEVFRTFTSVYDANHAFQAILDHPELARGQAYNVGAPGNHITIRDAAELMARLYAELTGRDVPCVMTEVSGEEFYGPSYEDMDRLPPDISKLQALGWTPTRDLETTFRDAMLYYVKRGDPTPLAPGSLIPGG